MRTEILNGLSAIPRDDWDALVGDGCPFLEWGWLASLEASGCVSPETGWLPQHIAIYEGTQLVAACPLYVKGHSQGEFVFDHGWADAAERAGIRYFPKLLAAVPFTPATGHRVLVGSGIDRAPVIDHVATVLKDICRQNGFSSAHVNFCATDELERFAQSGFLQRTGYQFQWLNRGWKHFDDYLESFRSKRRVQIKRERRELVSQDITISALEGEAIPDELFPVMYRLYRTTIDKLYWGRQYLNETLFELICQHWKKRLCFFVARRAGEIVAGTFTVRKGNVLYGRYWGTFREDLRYLHFNVCYYASIEYCLEHGISSFEPGAGGEFKHLRGFDARPTYSMHYLADSRLSAAVKAYLQSERAAIGNEIDWYEERSALKKTSVQSAELAEGAEPDAAGTEGTGRADPSDADE